MANYYAKIRVNNTRTLEMVNASNATSAKKLIEAKYGGAKVQYIYGPQRESGGKPPSWYK